MAAAAAGDQTFGHGTPDPVGPSPDRPRRFSLLSFTVGGVTGAAACLSVIGVASMALRDGDDPQRVETAANVDAETTEGDSDTFDRSVLSGAVAIGSSTPPTTAASTTTVVPTSMAAALATTQPVAASTTVTAPPNETGTDSSFAPIVSSPGLVAVYHRDASGELLGTGIVVDGLILTSAEACAGHDEFELELDGERFEAELLGVDRYSDLAVLAPRSAEVSPTPVNTLPPEVSNEPGELVTIIDASSTTRRTGADLTGEIVAVDERLTTRNGHHLIGALLTTVRHSDNGVGGALVDRLGNTIGIVVNSDSYHAAAIPLHDALDIGRSLAERGRPAEAWLGIEGVDGTNGIVIDRVTEASPAEVAGLRPGDVLTSLDGTGLTDMGQLVALLRDADRSAVLEISVLREGVEVMVAVDPATP